MKISKKFSAFFIPIVVVVIVMSCSSSRNVTALTGADIKHLIDSQRYVFIAQTVFPTSGRSRQLTPDYTLAVSADTVVSDLPYFGRAYSAPINPSEGGIRFTSTRFEYDVQQNKSGQWDVVIKPKDANDVREVNLTISGSGSATVQVLSNNRQPISFNGYIDRKKS